MDLQFFEQYAQEKLMLYNLNDWKLVWDTRPTTHRLGQCRYRRKEIGISIKPAKLLAMNEVIDTILHEIAHALTPGHHHDNVWKQKCIELGCRPVRCSSVNKDRLNVIAKYKGVCPTCGDVIYSGKKTGYVCTPCCNKEYSKTGSSNYKSHIYQWSNNN